MGKRGRKPASELTVRPATGVMVIKRPDPPDYLSEEAQAEWRKVVGGLAADYFGPATHGMLEAFCRDTVATRQVDQRIQNLSEEATVWDWSRLLAMHREEAKAMANIAVRLGIASVSRSSRFTSARPSPGPQPWED